MLPLIFIIVVLLFRKIKFFRFFRNSNLKKDEFVFIFYKQFNLNLHFFKYLFKRNAQKYGNV